MDPLVAIKCINQYASLVANGGGSWTMGYYGQVDGPVLGASNPWCTRDHIVNILTTAPSCSPLPWTTTIAGKSVEDLVPWGGYELFAVDNGQLVDGNPIGKIALGIKLAEQKLLILGFPDA